MALFKFTKAILENKKIDVFNYGKMERDFTYIEDLVEALYHLISHAPKSQGEIREKIKNDRVFIKKQKQRRGFGDW